MLLIDDNDDIMMPTSYGIEMLHFIITDCALIDILYRMITCNMYDSSTRNNSRAGFHHRLIHIIPVFFHLRRSIEATGKQ